MKLNWRQKERNFIRRVGRSTVGSVAVEFAITVPFFLIVLVGITDFARLYFAKSTMQFAVEETSRYAMVNPTVSTSALVAYAEGKGGAVSGITFTAASSTSGGINFRTITATYTYTYLMPILPLGTIPLSAQSATPINNS